MAFNLVFNSGSQCLNGPIKVSIVSPGSSIFKCQTFAGKFTQKIMVPSFCSDDNLISESALRYDASNKTKIYHIYYV